MMGFIDTEVQIIVVYCIVMNWSPMGGAWLEDRKICGNTYWRKNGIQQRM